MLASRPAPPPAIGAMRVRMKRIVDMECENWNLKYPPYTEVEYWPGAREGDPISSRTMDIARDLDGEPCVLIEGAMVAVRLSNVQPKGPGRRLCPMCNQLRPADKISVGPLLYEVEVNGNDTDYEACDDCRSESADAV